MADRAQGVAESRQQLVEEIEDHRASAAAVLAELDRRREALFDWHLQVRRHGLAIAIGAACVAAVVAAAVSLALHHRRVRARPLAKLGRLRLALHRMVEHPDRVAATREGNKGAGQTWVAAAGAAGKILPPLLVALARQRAR